jgi:asparagine synthase (glutamine-hydrolysing)
MCESQEERQPLSEPEAGCTLVFDGRLDNRPELISTLGLPSNAANSSDAVLVVEAYKRWSSDVPDHLVGDFAFALWDARRRELFCARDPVGARGFAFVHTRQFFAFASEVEALLHIPGVSAEPNELCIAQMLVRAFRDHGDRVTWLKDVEALLPGESMRVSPGGKLAVRQYWEPDLAPDRRYASYDECEEHFLSVFGQAVKDRTRAAGDVSMMLSGGLDSAALLAMQRRIAATPGGHPIHAYSAVDDDVESCIESRSIFSLAERNATPLHTVSVPSMRGVVSVEDLDRAAWANSHPVTNSILLPEMMCLAASRNGHKVMLHAANGDMAMQSPRFYPSQLIQRGRLLSAWQESRAASKNHLFLQGRAPSWIYLQSVARAVAPIEFIQVYQSWKFKRRPSAIAGTLINPEFASEIRLKERIAEEFGHDQQRRRANPRKFRIERCIEYVCSGLSGYNLVAGRHGVEVRDPWSDIRVLDFMFRLPDTYNNQDGWTKYLVRSAFREEIEPFVRQRKDKNHVGWKMVTRSLEFAHDRLSATIEEDLSLVAKYIDVGEFRTLAQPFVKRKDLSAYLPIFEILTLQSWLKRIGTL